jgi:hypothetical protein
MQICEGKHERMKPLGRQRSRKHYMDLKEIGWENMVIHAA